MISNLRNTSGTVLIIPKLEYGKGICRLFKEIDVLRVAYRECLKNWNPILEMHKDNLQ